MWVVKDKLHFIWEDLWFSAEKFFFSQFLTFLRTFYQQQVLFFTLKYPLPGNHFVHSGSPVQRFSGSRTILWTAGTFRFSSQLVSYEKRTFYWLEISWTMYLSFQTSYKTAGCIKAVCGFVHWLSSDQAFILLPGAFFSLLWQLSPRRSLSAESVPLQWRCCRQS